MITSGIALLLAASQAAAPAASRDLAPILAPILEKSGLPALGGAVVTSKGVEAIGAVGRRAWGESAAVTSEDRWHIGSCTKAMTATLAARWIERGALSWDTTIGSVFADSVPKMHAAWKDVTIAALLCHRSGASQNFTQDLWDRMEQHGGSLREQRRFFAEHGLAAAPDGTPNTETVYSNAGFLIAGAMIEKIADAAWEDLVRRDVFEPLGMKNSGFGAPGSAGALDQPLGHTRAAEGWTAIQVGPSADNPPAVGPAGTVHTTLADWARFVSAHLRGARGDESFLKKATWARLHTPIAGAGSYSPGWVVADEEWAGGVVLKHLGSNTYWVAQATLASEKDLAVLIVTNVGDDAAEGPFQDLFAALLDDHFARAK